jgi:transposase-like protein
MRQETLELFKKIPVGTYSLDQIAQIIGKDKKNVNRWLKKLPFKKVIGDELRGNIVSVKYKWEGFKHNG